MTNKIQVMVNEHNLPLYDFIEMFPDTNIVWLDNSKFYDSGIYYLFGQENFVRKGGDELPLIFSMSTTPP